MDDLISRWAAIDALTDTNLKRNVDSVCDGDMNRTRRAAQRVIAQLPAVDAIPVEWLKKLQNESPIWDFTASASGDIIRRWEREQGVGIDNSGKSGVWEPLGHISRCFAHPWSEYFKCSLCGYEAYTVFDPPSERCPECGAEMEQEAKE